MARFARALTLFALLLVPLAGPDRAWAGAPTDQLRAQIDRAVKILEDPEFKKDGRQKDRRTAVRQVANDIFDFSETAKRSLARHWSTRTPTEREEFVQLFSDLLERSYISKIELYGGERIQFTGESIETENAIVRTPLVTKQGTDIPIDYRMLPKGAQGPLYRCLHRGRSLLSERPGHFP